MVGKVRARIKALPDTGASTDVFRIRLATVAAPEDMVYDVQMKKGEGDWTRYRRGVKTRSVKFDPQGEGVYSVRSRVRRTAAPKGASGFSPAATVTVTA